MHKRLLTRDRLAKMGVCQDTECLLCGRKPESISHLFFECDYSMKCLQGTLEWLDVNINKTDLEELWSRIARRAKGKISRSLIRAIVAALIYHIWQARNGALWNKAVTKPTEILKRIKEESKCRMMDILQKKTQCKDKGWIENLYIEK